MYAFITNEHQLTLKLLPAHHRQLNSHRYPPERARSSSESGIDVEIALQLGLRFGIIHPDPKDDEASYSLLIPTGLLPTGSYGGLFLDARSGSFIEWDPSDLGIFLFRGSDSHVGTTAALPPTYDPPPFGYIYSRSLFVCYPARLAVQKDPPIVLEASDLVNRRGVLRGIHPGIPLLGDQQAFAAVGGELAAKLLLLNARAREHFRVQLQRMYRFSDYQGTSLDDLIEARPSIRTELQASIEANLMELATEYGEFWRSVVQRQARMLKLDIESPEVLELIRRGNPFGFVPGDDSVLWSSSAERSSVIALASDYFGIAARSAMTPRTMIQAARRSESAIAFAWRQGWSQPILATTPPALAQYLNQDRGAMSLETAHKVACDHGLETTSLAIEYGPWQRDESRQPEPPVPPITPHLALFSPQLVARRTQDPVEWARYEGSANISTLEATPGALGLLLSAFALPVEPRQDRVCAALYTSPALILTYSSFAASSFRRSTSSSSSKI